MPIKDAKFLCACEKHNCEAHDGTKNECCDSAVILPLLSAEDLAKLVPNGQEQYKEDLLKLASLVESSAVSLASIPNAQEWYQNVGFPIIADKFNAMVAEEQTAEPEIIGGTLEETNGSAFEDIYAAGFQAGFCLAYEKGYDAGVRLSVTRK